MPPQTILYIILGIIIFNYLLSRVLDYLNMRNWSDTLPDELKPFYDADKYKKAQQYHKEKNRLSFYIETLNVIIMIAFILWGGFGKLSLWLEQHISNPKILALVFFAVLSVAGDIINLPFGLYNTFKLEEKYGFNKTTAKTYILDKLKGYALAIIVGGVIGYFLLRLIMEIGDSFWIYAWIFAAGLILFMNVFYTSLIVPLFNKLKPLQEGSLREKIETYASKVNFPLTNILVIDGSKRSTKANAFFSGMGSRKKVVLYDTLIEKHTEEELVGVLAHEVGHYKKKHIIKGLVIGILQTGLTLWILSRFIFSDELSQALGAPDWRIHINLVAFSILYEPISLLIGLAMNALSRKHEFEADRYAAETSDKEAFKQALIKLSVDNLSNLKPHPAYVFFHYSHPPVLERLAAMDR